MSQRSEGFKMYEIQVQGYLDPDWSDWFEGFTIRHGSAHDGSPLTILSGTVTDQSALSGILVQLFDLNFPLISVNPAK
jgi:hypothetical protein